MKRIYGYLSRFKRASICIRTDMPDFSDLMVMDQDWANTPYTGAKEEQPSNLPPAKGKPVRLFTYADANLMYDALSGKAVTAVLHSSTKIHQQTPFDWFSRKQLTVLTQQNLEPKPVPPGQQTRQQHCTLESPYVVLPSFLMTTRLSSKALRSRTHDCTNGI